MHRFTTQLLRDGRVDDQTYRDTVALVGEQGAVELVVLCGYYTLVALLLNAFQIPAFGEGEEPTWADLMLDCHGRWGSGDRPSRSTSRMADPASSPLRIIFLVDPDQGDHEP